MQILPVSGLPEMPLGDDRAGLVRSEATGLAIGVLQGIDPSDLIR